MAKKKQQNRNSKGQWVSRDTDSKRKNVKRDASTGRFVSNKGDKNARVLAATVGGAVIGNILLPGIGGAIAGGLAGALLGNNSNEEADDERS